MTSSAQGVSGFLVKETKGAEWGLYRLNLEGYEYLLLPFTDIEEALTVGKALAEMIKEVKNGNKTIKVVCRIDRSKAI